MNDLTLLREHGPAAPPLRPAVLDAARARLTAATAAPPGTTGSVRRATTGPQSSTRRRLAIVTTAAVAACAAAVAGVALTGQPAPAPGPITLVAFETPSFPVSLRPEPPGLTASFDREPDGRMLAVYRDRDRGRPGESGFVVVAGPPRSGPVAGETVEDVSIGGRAARLVVEPAPRTDGTVGERAVVTWQRPQGEWITISAQTAPYTGRDALLALAATVVDEPRPVPLQLRLAPAGWSVHAFKERVLTLVDDADESRTLSIHVPFEPPPATADLPRLVEGVAGDVRAATVHGRPAQLVPTTWGWRLQAAFPDGTPFVLQAPAPFTADDVLAVAGEAAYTG